MQRNDILERKEEILEWIATNQSKAFICRELRCKPETLNSYLEKMGIKYEGNQGGKGLEKHSTSYKSAAEYAQEANVKSVRLKEKLLKEGIKEYKCELCNLDMWLDQPIPLELHHVDGNHYNNDFSNLQILCPNCHAQQNNNSGKNCGKNKIEKEEKLLNYCCDCGTVISSRATRCRSCAAKNNNLVNRVVEDRPTREELKNMIRTLPFTQIANKFGVSDNAIRKWCKTENLPSSKKEINSYSNEDWEAI